MNIDRTKVVHAARMGIPLVVKTHTLPSTTEVELEEILCLYLEELGQSGLKDHLSYCLRELTGNAKKANTKRVYFEEKGLSLADPAEYARGMKTFKPDTLSNIARYLKLQEEKDLWIKVTFLIKKQVLYLNIRNNAPALHSELTRVFDRIARSRAFNSMEEAFEEVLDDSEGAGLGLTILILMLRKMGLTEKSFNLSVLGEETSASLTIPMESVKFAQIEALTTEMLDAVESLPPFPDNLRKVLALLDTPDVEFQAVATQLSRDPALTAGLIRYLNSARLGNRKKIGSLRDAVQIIGLKGLKDFLFPYGAHQALAPYLERQKGLWDNASRVSSYAAGLAREEGFGATERNLAQIAGILYNLGQILITHLHPDQSSRILEFCRSKGLGADLFDSLTQAINPAELGARAAERWGFPEDLVEVLRNQSRPQGAPQALKPVACLVYLAGHLLWLEQGLVQPERLDPVVLRALKLDDPEKLAAVHQKLKREFETTD